MHSVVFISAYQYMGRLYCNVVFSSTFSSFCFPVLYFAFVPFSYYNHEHPVVCHSSNTVIFSVSISSPLMPSPTPFPNRNLLTHILTSTFFPVSLSLLPPTWWLLLTGHSSPRTANSRRMTSPRPASTSVTPTTSTPTRFTSIMSAGFPTTAWMVSWEAAWLG